MKTTPLLTALLLITLAPVWAVAAEFYQLRIYHLKSEEQESRVDRFLETAYLPALHRLHIAHVGVFKPSEFAEIPAGEKRIYVFVPYTSFDNLLTVEQALEHDQQYQSAGSDYLDASYDQPPYERIETIFLNAFTDSPTHDAPALTGPKAERIYELRSYEGPTEKLYNNKVQMFNEGDEIGLFKRLGFNAVFYGDVLAGSRMPNLMYMTSFENKAARDEHWKTFSADPQWKELSALPIYQHNVSRSEFILLTPTDYSDY